MSFLDEYDAVDAAGQAALVRQWLANRPLELFAELRARKPIFSTPLGVIVTKRNDVLEVLSHDEEFSVRLYTPRMEQVTGSFILGMDNTPSYQHEISILRLAIRREDLPRIKEIVARHVGRILDEALLAKRIDIVNGLGRLVATRLVADYFGVRGPDEPTMIRWLNTIFNDIFLNLRNDAEIHATALRSAKEMSAYVDRLIINRQTKNQDGEAADDVLGRLLQLQSSPGTYLDNESIRRNLMGLIAGALDTTAKAFAHSIDQLMRRPDKLRAAQKAAAAGDDGLVFRYVSEALRFNPQNIFLLRHCETPYTVAEGTKRATRIEKNKIVFVATSSAMFDAEEIEAPEEFRIDRPLSDYIHFGYGLHRCFGEHISQVQITELATQLLKLPGLRRLPGPDGELKYSGSIPESMSLAFD